MGLRPWLREIGLGTLVVFAAFLLFFTFMPNRYAGANSLLTRYERSQPEHWPSSSSGLHRAPNPTRRPDYSTVDPQRNIIVNDKVVSVNKIYRDLWGSPGLEHGEMAKVLGLEAPTPNYRNVNLSNWGYGGAPKEWIDVLKRTTCKTWFGLTTSCYADEKDKVWLYDATLRQALVITWTDTFANGKRVGDGFYKRDGQKAIRFDEVVPYYGGFVSVNSRGLIQVTMPPRNEVATDAESCIFNRLLNAEGDCNIKEAFLSSAYGTFGKDKLFAILGWQADTNNNTVADTIRRELNYQALKIEGRTPTMKDKLVEMADTAAFWIPFIVLVMEANLMAGVMVEYYFPRVAPPARMSVAVPRTAEWADEAFEREAAVIAGVRMSEAEVTALARQKYGIDKVVGEFQGASQRGWYWKIRSMTPSAARAQMMQDGEVLEIVPGKYIAREFYTGGSNGVWMDGYDEVSALLRENKGFYRFMVKNGSIDPAFIKNEKFLNIVDQLERQVTAARVAGDRLQWIFNEPEFPRAFENWLAINRPALYRLMGTSDGKVFTFVIH